MADTEDLSNLSAQAGNSCVDGVKVGEPLTVTADGNAELRPVSTGTSGYRSKKPAKCRDETAPS